MVELTIHAVQWCAEHGHPVLTLRVRDRGQFCVVAISGDDAAALAPAGETARSHPRNRLLTLVEATIAALGARRTEVRLHVTADALLGAALHLDAPGGPIALPVHFADAIALAHRADLPMRMAEPDLARAPIAPWEQAPTSESRPATAASEPDLTPFRDLIASLDLDDIGNGTAPR